MKKYEFLEHTADLKIRVYGKNLEDLINNSLLALKNFLKPKLISKKEDVSINIKGRDVVFLLVDFLSEVLAQIYVKKAIFLKFESKKLTQNRIEGRLKGIKFISLQKDIKAITYHQATIYQKNNKFVFEFIVDI